VHPVQFTAENVTPRSRLTTFFRWILTIPHAIFVAIYAIAVYVAVILAWFAILFTGRYPTALFDFVTGFLRYYARVQAYSVLIADRFPPFGAGGTYTAELTIARPERLSRLTTFFRALLMIPAYILQYVLNIAAIVVAVIQWLVIVVTGSCPDGLHNFQCMAQRFALRLGAYATLVTDRYPNFEESPTAASAGPSSTWDDAEPGTPTW
jgi:hypothetical protein